jgi:hypothetical protein
MSFDIFLLACKDGEVGALDVDLVARAFGPLAKPLEDGSWAMLFDDGEHYGSYLDFSEETESVITGFGIGDPPFSNAFLEALMDILRQTPSILYWPSDGVWACAASADVFDQAPADMFNSRDELAVASSIADLKSYLELDFK